MRQSLTFIRSVWRSSVTQYTNAHGVGGAVQTVFKRLGPALPEVGIYFGSVAGCAYAWYKYTQYHAWRAPRSEWPTVRPLQFDCTVESKDLAKCGYPPPQLFENLGKHYGFNVAQAAWSASHFCPIEFHAMLVENILLRLGPSLSEIVRNLDASSPDTVGAASPKGTIEENALPEKSSKVANTPSKLKSLVGAIVSGMSDSQPQGNLAQSVIALFEEEVRSLKPYFESAALFDHVPFEDQFLKWCNALETNDTLSALPVEDKVNILLESLRRVLYEYLVANWEASRYFDPHSYKEGYFGPRKTHMAEGFDSGMRSASFLMVDKPELRVDCNPEMLQAVTEAREACRQWERTTDKSFLQIPSKERRQRQREGYLMSFLTQDKKAEFNWAKAKTGKSFLNMSRDEVLGSADRNVVYPHGINPLETFLSPDEFGLNGLDFDTLKEASRILQKHGFVRIKRAVSKDGIDHLKRNLFISPFSARDFGDKLTQVDSNIYTQRMSLGRVTAFLRGSSLEPFLVELQRSWMPVVYAMMPTEFFYGTRPLSQLKKSGGKIHEWAREYNDPDYDPDAPQDKPAIAEIPCERLYASAMHAVVQDVSAPEEGFAIDNAKYDCRHPSISVMLALDELKSGKDATGGPQFIPGAHHIGVLKRHNGWRHLWQRNWKAFIKDNMLRGGGPVNIYLAPGDLLIWDARLWRRNHGVNPQHTSAYLIFHYDYPSGPCPSQVGLQLLLNKAKSAVIYWMGLLTRLAYAKVEMELQRRELREQALGKEGIQGANAGGISNVEIGLIHGSGARTADAAPAANSAL